MVRLQKNYVLKQLFSIFWCFEVGLWEVLVLFNFVNFVNEELDSFYDLAYGIYFPISLQFNHNKILPEKQQFSNKNLIIYSLRIQGMEDNSKQAKLFNYCTGLICQIFENKLQRKLNFFLFVPVHSNNPL